MRRSRPVWWCCALVLSAGPVRAAPTGEEVLQKMRQAYRGMTSFEESAVETIHVTRGEDSQTVEYRHLFVYQAPNRFYYDIVLEEETRLRAVCDGARLVSHQSSARGDRYQRAEAPATLLGSAALMGKVGAATHLDPLAFLTGNDPLSAGMDAELVGEETFEGRPVYVVRVSRQGEQRYTLRIGRDDHLLYQSVSQMSREIQGQTVTQTVTETHRDLKINAAVDEARFALAIPADAQVEEVIDLVGKPAPPVRLTTLGDETIDLASLRGKTVLLNFWAHW